MTNRKLLGLLLILPFTIYMWTLTLDVFFNDFPVYHLPYSVTVTAITIALTAFVIDTIIQIRK